MTGLELVEDRVNHSLRQSHIKVVQRLPGILRLHGLHDLLIEVLLLRGQLAHASGGKDGSVGLALHLVDPLVCLLLDVVLDALQHLVKGGGKRLGVVVFDGLLEFGPDVVPGQSIAISHFVLLSNNFIMEFLGTGGSARGSSFFSVKTFCMIPFFAAWATGTALSAAMDVAIPYSRA